ncbi:hypothetical protein [Actinacidiphila bryophytorum]|uniref:hypothetical protein n=1 Tax=Actinacidiphila bryophytorum TaxID=1436133 RepID=UPI002176A6C5|nr:hypothetical protein [Actinacidiphila bryophytorum]UWE13026.1 hypothetical protein NYE86_32990 [Actinacidiphila bryophytorum]
MKRTVLATALMCTTAAVVLTGCGGKKDAASSPASAPADTATATTPAKAKAAAAAGPLDGLTAQQISDRTVADMNALTSVHVVGQEMDGDTPAHVDVTVATSGKCLATVGEGGGDMKVISTTEYTYMKGDSTFWKAQGKDGVALGTALHGRWLKKPGKAASDPDLKEFCDLKTFMAGFTADDGAPLTKGAAVKLGGQRVIPLTQHDSDGDLVVYVADTAKPYAVKFDEPGKDGPGTDGSGTITFSGFDKPLHVYAPPQSQTVTEDALTV